MVDKQFKKVAEIPRLVFYGDAFCRDYRIGMHLKSSITVWFKFLFSLTQQEKLEMSLPLLIHTKLSIHITWLKS